MNFITKANKRKWYLFYRGTLNGEHEFITKGNPMLHICLFGRSRTNTDEYGRILDTPIIKNNPNQHEIFEREYKKGKHEYLIREL